MFDTTQSSRQRGTAPATQANAQVHAGAPLDPGVQTRQTEDEELRGLRKHLAHARQVLSQAQNDLAEAERLEALAGKHAAHLQQLVGGLDRVLSELGERPANASVAASRRTAQDCESTQSYLTLEELAERLGCSEETIRETLADSGFRERVHYIQPFGPRLLFIWKAIARDIAIGYARLEMQPARQAPTRSARTAESRPVATRPVATKPVAPKLVATQPVATRPAALTPVPTTRAVPSFAEFAASWLQKHQHIWARSNMLVQQSTVGYHLVPRFGDRLIDSITADDLRAFRAHLAQLPGRAGAKLSNKRINGILDPLRQMLEAAAALYGFRCPRTGRESQRSDPNPIEPFTLEQVQQIRASAPPQWHPYVTVRFFTGMSAGEIHGLKWCYVNFADQVIQVRESFVVGEDKLARTERSHRVIRMAPEVVEALKAQRTATAGRSDYVFCNREGKPLDNKNFATRVWYPLLSRLGLDQRAPSQMRHTAAMLWITAGEGIESTARQLGIAPKRLERAYRRYFPANTTLREGAGIDRMPATGSPCSCPIRPPSAGQAGAPGSSSNSTTSRSNSSSTWL